MIREFFALFNRHKIPVESQAKTGFSSPQEYNNFKKKYLPTLAAIVFLFGLGFTLLQVQTKQDIRQQAQVIQSTPAQVNKFIFGICAHLTRRSVEPPPGKFVDLVNQELDLVHNIGATMYREDFDWGTIEPINNQFNFATYDTTVNNAKARGLEPLAILDYRVGWTGGLNSDQFRTDFADYTYNTVLHFKDRVHYWEVWNEETGWWFWDKANHSTDPIAYGKLLLKAGQAIKRADPNAKVVFGGTHALQGLLDPNANSYVSKALAVSVDGVRAYDVVDVIAGHAYIDRFSGQTPENLYNLNVSQYYERYDNYLKTTYGAGKKYWHTETGWSTSTGGGYAVSEDMQANLIIRMYLLFLGGGKVDAFFAYDARNDGTNAADYEQNLGFVKHDFAPKPVISAYQTMTKLLSNASFTEKLPWTDGSYGYVFTDFSKAQKIYSLWSPTTDITKSVQIDATTAKKVSLLGAEETVQTQNGAITITLTKRPQYIVVTTGPTPTDDLNAPPTPTPTVTPNPSSTIAIPTPFYLRSDFGGLGGAKDGKVDIQDFNILAGEFYLTNTNLKSDIIKDGLSLNKVDIQDYNAFVGDYQAYLAR